MTTVLCVLCGVGQRAQSSGGVQWAAYRATTLPRSPTSSIPLGLEAITKSSRLKIFNKNSLNNNIFFKVCCSILVYFIFSFSLIFGGPFESLNECLFVIEKIFLNNDSFSHSKIELLKLIILILLVLFLEFKQEYYPEKLKLFRNKNLLIRWISYLSIILFIVLLGVFSNDNFIYFQF